MRNVIVICAAALFVPLACNRTEPAPSRGRVDVQGAQPGTAYVEGHVKTATDSELRLDTDSRIFRVDPNASIVLDSAPATALDLPAGAEVRAAFRVVDGQSVVTDVVARTRRGQGKNAATRPGQPKVP